MAIEIQDGFDISTNIPVDSRFIRLNLAQRDAIVPEVRYEGLATYVVSEGKTYRLVGGTANENWIEDGGGGGAGAGGSGTFAFISSKNVEEGEWDASHGTVEVTEDGEVLGETEFTWESDGGLGTRTITGPIIPAGKYFQTGSANTPIAIEFACFGVFPFAPGVMYEVELLSYSSADVIIGSTSEYFTSPAEGVRAAVASLYISSPLPVSYFRVRISAVGIDGPLTVRLDNISLTVKLPHTVKIRKIVTIGSHELTPSDEVVIVSTGEGDTGEVEIVPSPTGQKFTVKFVPTNEVTSVRILGAEPEYENMYSNESRTFIHDYSEAVWRAI